MAGGGGGLEGNWVGSIGVRFGCVGGKIDGDSWFTWWFNHLPGKPIYLPQKDIYGCIFNLLLIPEMCVPHQPAYKISSCVVVFVASTPFIKVHGAIRAPKLTRRYECDLPEIVAGSS